ncbi:uroporphyrinogen decarboxylase family protein [Natronorubrum sp. FCH18a]|uniref:uroporphyrinogen decarboxylase family protein n=1 Tax=Natronorubrum sp. FCH18a TaxID=3447018 RepID=UPI003F510F0A
MSGHSPPIVDYLRGRQAAPQPWLPLIGRLAATINQLPTEIFLSNATQQTNAIQSAYRLFEPDAVCTGIDTTLVAEALGAGVEWDEATDSFTVVQPVESSTDVADPTTAQERGRLPVVTDVGERLATNLDEPAIVGVVPGPLTTLETAFGEDAALEDEWTKPVRTAVGELGREFGKADVDVILVYEDVDQLAGETESDDAATVTVDTLEMLDNITSFYNTPLLVAPNGYAEGTIDTVLEAADPAGVLLDTDAPGETAERYSDVRVGGGITAALLDENPDDIRSAVADRYDALPKSVFLASGREIPPDSHPTKLQAVNDGRQRSDE